MGMFMKNGGRQPGKNNFTTKGLLEVDVTDSNLQLSIKIYGWVLRLKNSSN